MNNLNEQIWQAIEDYGRHTSQTEVLDDVSNAFVDRLARDSWKAKSKLRELLRKSPGWNEDLQAVVINGTRTHDPNYTLINALAFEILDDALQTSDEERRHKIITAVKFFSKTVDEETGIAAIESLAPNAYRPNKKISRVFKSLCDALGVTNETCGSSFQKLFAELADEMNGRKLKFKVFLSIHPAHFVTMSNPKNDLRGHTLTSCHTFNSTEFDYNVGCAGYARDEVTMIAFMVSNPDKPELLNNRKNMRQLFMYKVGSGVLLQSRLYNDRGGTHGAQKESNLYRDLVQRELSALEGAPNLWKTEKYIGNKHHVYFDTAAGFGGYPDWQYEEFDARLSIRADHADDYEGFDIGTYGLCIVCGTLITKGLYCPDCGSERGHSRCECCGENCSEIYTVHNRYGELIEVCENCLDGYQRCDDCGEYYPVDEMEEIDEDCIVCASCLENNYEQCADCGCWYRTDDDVMYTVYDRHDEECRVCENCLDDYSTCEYCEDHYHYSLLSTAYDSDGNEVSVCEYCRRTYYKACEQCGRAVLKEELEDGLCTQCRAEKENRAEKES